MSASLTGGMRIEQAGIELVLLPERVLWIPAFDTVLVADLHWGKAAAFRAAHVPVPVGPNTKAGKRVLLRPRPRRVTCGCRWPPIT
jgi:hypothetical protein